MNKSTFYSPDYPADAMRAMMYGIRGSLLEGVTYELREPINIAHLFREVPESGRLTVKVDGADTRYNLNTADGIAAYAELAMTYAVEAVRKPLQARVMELDSYYCDIDGRKLKEIPEELTGDDDVLRVAALLWLAADPEALDFMAAFKQGEPTNTIAHSYAKAGMPGAVALAMSIDVFKCQQRSIFKELSNVREHAERALALRVNAVVDASRIAFGSTGSYSRKRSKSMKLAAHVFAMPLTLDAYLSNTKKTRIEGLQQRGFGIKNHALWDCYTELKHVDKDLKRARDERLKEEEAATAAKTAHEVEVAAAFEAVRKAQARLAELGETSFVLTRGTAGRELRAVRHIEGTV